MSLYGSLVRPLAFRVDPETAHEVAMGFLSRGLLKARPFEDARLRQTFFGVEFPNPLGLAAGFDKNGVGLDHWHQLGFGFVEVGTVTYHEQPGNPRPRLFRIPEQQALINRLGFNNDGARKVATRLAEARSQIPVGVNLGKSKVTELPAAAEDYAGSFRLLHGFGNYFVVNVSSPNTPGLRTLQERGPLLEILYAMREIDAERPIFVKVAPDLEMSALDDVISVAHEANLAGLIATNTTLSREGIGGDVAAEAGGLSGAPLRDRSNKFLAHVAGSVDADKIVMGVGGIMNGDDLYEKIRLGAHLCQIYTGWIYGGPLMIPDALARLTLLLERDGHATVAAARGTGR